jgi:pimeloyl-ACP methyl ester carboxylesterase
MCAATNKQHPTHHFVRANGVGISYESFGTGRPVVFLHGSLATGRAWQPCIPALSSEAALIIPDLRGHGRPVNDGCRALPAAAECSPGSRASS